MPPTPCPDMECEGHIGSLVPVYTLLFFPSLCGFESRSVPLGSPVSGTLTAVSPGMWTCPWAVTGCQARSRMRAGARVSEGIDGGASHLTDFITECGQGEWQHAWPLGIGRALKESSGHTNTWVPVLQLHEITSGMQVGTALNW